ncbi:MAG TPA: hypothetical protein DHW82_14325 [Spirochaetia bacterium]|nr:hypothetical protein [Spirochaetia bacterium]
MVWEEPELEKLNTGLIKLFDLRVRYKEIEYTFKIIEDSLTVFRELNLHKESNRLEWIIIVLILIEVFDLILSKFLKLF